MKPRVQSALAVSFRKFSQRNFILRDIALFRLRTAHYGLFWKFASI